jgi:hypothetical protein
MRGIYGAFLSVILLPGVSYASFDYHGKPISPDCLVKLADVSGNNTKSVKVESCSSKDAVRKIHFKQGVYTTKDEHATTMTPFADYSVIGQLDNKYLLDFGQWTGGTGFYTTVLWVSYVNDEITLLNEIAGGDRCNGGTEKTGEWEYSINLTSTELINTAENKSINIKSHKDLDSSAADCVAKQHFKFDPVKAKEEFQYVTLNDEEDSNEASWSAQFTYQKCLDDLLRTYINAEKTKLDKAELKTLAEKFKAKCMKG